MTYADRKEARPDGWHSRRHQTRDAQDAAREQYKAERGRAARVRRAKERALEGWCCGTCQALARAMSLEVQP